MYMPTTLNRHPHVTEAYRRMSAAEEVVNADLDYINAEAAEEFSELSGKELLIAGGAGFLGYYLVQAPLNWNRNHGGEAPIKVTVLDNFIRGVPAWLTALEIEPESQAASNTTSPIRCRRIWATWSI